MQAIPSLVIRNLIFTVLQPGVVAGLVPWYLAKDKFREAFNASFQLYHYGGALLFLIGFAILLHCIYRFIVEGLGTISPADPTTRLVVKGLYRFSRNPMYVGVMMMLIGEATFTASSNLWIYSGCIFLAFHLFILLVEEPRLRKDFGEAYDVYCQRVRRWI